MISAVWSEVTNTGQVSNLNLTAHSSKTEKWKAKRKKWSSILHLTLNSLDVRGLLSNIYIYLYISNTLFSAFLRDMLTVNDEKWR